MKPECSVIKECLHYICKHFFQTIKEYDFIVGHKYIIALIIPTCFGMIKYDICILIIFMKISILYDLAVFFKYHSKDKKEFSWIISI